MGIGSHIKARSEKEGYKEKGCTEEGRCKESKSHGTQSRINCKGELKWDHY